MGGIIRAGEEGLDSDCDLGVAGGGVVDGEASVEQAQQFVNDELKVGLSLLGRLGPGDERDERHEVGLVAQILRQVENHALNDSETFLNTFVRLKSVHKNGESDVAAIVLAAERCRDAVAALAQHDVLVPAQAVVEVGHRPIGGTFDRHVRQAHGFAHTAVLEQLPQLLFDADVVELLLHAQKAADRKEREIECEYQSVHL